MFGEELAERYKEEVRGGVVYRRIEASLDQLKDQYSRYKTEE